MATQHLEPLVLYIDGSSRGNPGPAGIGVVAFEGADSDSPIKEISKYIGITTNNVAEYEALIHALKFLATSHRKRAIIKLDSELVYKQVTGRYKVRKQHIAIQLKRVRMLQHKIEELSFLLIPREENKHADRLAQRASKKMKRKKTSFSQEQLLE